MHSDADVGALLPPTLAQRRIDAGPDLANDTGAITTDTDATDNAPAITETDTDADATSTPA